MKITQSSSLRGVAFVVCTALDQAGIRAILTGGSAATVYAPNEYQSHDLDFVIEFRASGVDAGRVVAALGYELAGDHYVHRENPLILEFPPGPLMVGGDLVRDYDTLRESEMVLHVLTPTDCCKDRLAGFIFWNDRGSLEQAVAVARAQKTQVNLKQVRRWCEREGRLEHYGEFERRLRLDR